MNVLHFDLETEADEDLVRLHLPEFPDYDTWEASDEKNRLKLGRLSDPAKIQAKRDDHREKYEKAKASQFPDAMKKAALSPYTGRILTVQFRHDGETDIFHVGEERALDGACEISFSDEEMMIQGVWSRLVHQDRNGGRSFFWPGHNKSAGGFDPFWLRMRSLALGIKPPQLRHMENLTKRFLGEESEWGEYCGIDKAARHLGIEPADCGDVTGKNFAAKWHSEDEQDRKNALAYARWDVEAMEAIWERVTL